MDIVEFKKSVLKLNGTRTHRLNNSYGAYDAYKYIRKNGWMNLPRPVTEGEFYRIIRSVNNILAEMLSYGKSIKLPYRMGSLEFIKKDSRSRYDSNGRLVIKKMIDWDNTLNLWYNDDESRKSKTLVYHNDRYTFSIRYNKSNANYNNKQFYEFKLNRGIKRLLKERIASHEIDAYLYDYGKY